MRHPTTAAVLAVALIATGCATMGGKLEPPRLSLVKASMLSGDVFSQQFSVRVHVVNPNARSLPIKSIQYQLFLEGDSFAEGESAAPFVVPADGSSDFDLTVHTNFMSSIARLLSRLTGSNRTGIDYRFSGAVTLDLPFSPKLNFNEKGTVDLSRR